MELCLLSLVIIYKPVPVDVASTVEVNHVKPACYVIDACDCICLLLSVIQYMNLGYHKYMYVSIQFTAL